MEQQLILEVVGYVASALVAISLMMRSILRLRLINLAGAAAFAVYGFLIGALPVAAVNVFIVFINLYYLHGMLRAREYFSLLEVRPTADYPQYFLRFYAEEIRRFWPGGPPSPADAQLALFVLRDMIPAGLLMGQRREDGSLLVTLDFVIPDYRDFKIGRFLFREQGAFFRERGIRQIASRPGTAVHEKYLRRMGFIPADPGDPEGLYRLTLA
jgi:GNAT superfamily N-acetyltransferase